MAQPRFSLRRPIAGELSDMELQLEEEVQQLADTPRFQPDALAGPSAGYAILKEDLKMRAMQNRDLADRQRIAFASSSRRHMANTIAEQNAETEAAKAGLSAISNMVQDGMSEEEAESAYFRKNPHAAMNGALVGSLQHFKAFNEDPHERFVRTQGQKIEKSRLLADGYSAELAAKSGEWKLGEIDSIREMTLKGIEAGLIRGDAEVTAARFDKLKTELQWTAAQNNIGVINAALQSIGSPALDAGALMRAQAVMLQNGINMPNRMRTFALHHAPDNAQLGFLSDPGSMDAYVDSKANKDLNRAAQVRQELQQSIADLDDPTLYEQAQGTGVEAVKAQERISRATRILDEGAAIYYSRHSRNLEVQAMNQQLLKNSKELAGKYSGFISKIQGTIFTDSGVNKKGLKQARSIATSFVDYAAKELGVPLSSDFSNDAKLQMILEQDSSFELNDDEGSIDALNESGQQRLDAAGEEMGLWFLNEGAPPVLEDPDDDDAYEYEEALRTWVNDRMRVWTTPKQKRVDYLSFSTGLDSSGDERLTSSRSPIREKASTPGGASTQDVVPGLDNSGAQTFPVVDEFFSGTGLFEDDLSK